MDLSGTQAATAGALITASNSAVLDLISASAPLLSMTRSAALATGSNLADISGGATVKLGQLAALTGSTLAVQGHALTAVAGQPLPEPAQLDLLRVMEGDGYLFNRYAVRR